MDKSSIFKIFLLKLICFVRIIVIINRTFCSMILA